MQVKASVACLAMELSMSPLTIFLGKLIGIYCIIVTLALMAQKQRTVEAVNGLIRSPALRLLVEVIALIAGLAMIIGHNVWSGGAHLPSRFGCV